MNRLTLLLIPLIFFISGCQSGTMISAGGYRMIHFNNPECMGSSASGAMILHEKTEDVVKANIGFKSGYCESITGQVISVGGEVAGKVIVADGLKKSGSDTTVKSSQETGITGGGTGGSPGIGGISPN